MKDRTKARLANIDARFGARVAAFEAARRDDREAFLGAFLEVRTQILVPVLHEIGAALATGTRRYAVELRDGERPAATLRLFLTSLRPEGHTVAFEVIDRGRGLEVLVWLEASPPPMDLARYAPDALDRDVVEQIVVDAVEQIYACVAEMKAE